jgi:hypothetical protein
MRVTELELPDYPQCITGTPTESGAGRSTGTLHLSTIYRDMFETAIQSGDSDITQDELAWYAAGGFIWEQAFSLAYREAVVGGDLARPDEWELDGIVGSPDVIRLSDWTLIELKCRWMSSWKLDALEKHFWLTLVQVKSYCLMVGTDHAELHVFFVNGDYRPPMPRVRGVALEFTQRELQENWDAVTGHAKRRGWL